MTVICPNCDARYSDPPAGISIDRPLQCSQCEHEWVRSVEDRLEVEAPSLAPAMQALLDDRDDEIRTNLPVVVSEDDEVTPQGPVFVDVLPNSAKGKMRSWWPVAGLACIGLLAGLITLRATLVEQVPQAGDLLAAAGIQIDDNNLSIANIETHRDEVDGIRQLIVRGEIENQAAHQVPVPPIKLTMRGESSTRLYAWTVSAAKTSLKAGERSRFTAVARDYPLGTVDVEVEFEPQK